MLLSRLGSSSTDVWLLGCGLLFCLLLSITHTSSGSANSLGEAAVARCFICVEVASFALHMSNAFASDRSGSLRSLLRVPSSRIPHTMRSLIYSELTRLRLGRYDCLARLLIPRVKHVTFPRDVFSWVAIGLEFLHYSFSSPLSLHSKVL